MNPIIDLHMHLDGSLPLYAVEVLMGIYPHYVPEKYKPLLDMEAGERLWNLKKELRAPQNCRSLSQYLKCFDLPCALMKSSLGMSIILNKLLDDLAQEGLRYVEIRYAPQLHSPECEESVRYQYEKEMLEAMLSAVQSATVKVNFILCMMRNLPERNKLGYDPNVNTLKLAREFLGKGVCAVDLAGAEARDATSAFRKLFEMASEMGLPFTIHAGEAGNREWRLESLKSAIEFGAKRLGHGIALEHAPELRAICKERGIGIECCPVSNLQTQAVCGGIGYHPLPLFLEEGLLVSVNTDNLTVSNTNLRKEFELFSKIGIGEAEQRILTMNAINSSFADEATKTWLRTFVK